MSRTIESPPRNRGGRVRQETVAEFRRLFGEGPEIDGAILLKHVSPNQAATFIAQYLAVFLQVAEDGLQTITTTADLNALLLSAKDRSIVHIDEAHQLGKNFQTALYLALDQKKILLSGSKAIQSIPVADFTLLLSTTDEYCLLQPLRDRMKLLLRYEYYSLDELHQIVRRYAKTIGWDVEEGVISEIAVRSRGTPRLAIRLLQSAYRFTRAIAETMITQFCLGRACELEQIDRLGLGVTEQKYLKLLVDGPKRLNVLASLLGLPTRTVAEVTEPFLIRSGLIIKDDQGVSDQLRDRRRPRK